MSFLMTHLPPFAADYSGVASALHDLGGLVVIHDASGCTGSYTGYDEPRWFESRSGVFCSGLRELDAVMGNDDKLLDNIKRAIAGRDYRFVAIVASPVPMLVGFDTDGFANLVEHETGLPAFGFPTTGLRLYHDGLAAAFLALAKRFVAEPVGSAAGANILGASPLDNIDADDMARLAGIVASARLPLVSVWGQDSSLAAIANAAGAAVNLVVSAAALPIARFMRTRWGIPYVAARPLDPQDDAEIADALARAARGETAPASPARRAGAPANTAPIVLVGEQLAMRAWRQALARRSDTPIRIASFFAWDDDLAEPGDRFLANEADAIDWLRGLDAVAVVGDPLLAALLPSARRGCFVALSHRGISGRLDRRSGEAPTDAVEAWTTIVARCSRPPNEIATAPGQPST